jgi:chromosomal replication initiator protein
MGARTNVDVDVKALWQAALGELEVTLSGANFKTWFRNTSMLSNQDGYVVISVPNVMTKQWLETKFRDEIYNTLGKMTAVRRPIRAASSNLGPLKHLS